MFFFIEENLWGLMHRGEVVFVSGRRSCSGGLTWNKAIIKLPIIIIIIIIIIITVNLYSAFL